MTDQPVSEDQQPARSATAADDLPTMQVDFLDQPHISPFRATFHAVYARHSTRHTDISIYFCDESLKLKHTQIFSDNIKVGSTRRNVLGVATVLEGGVFINLVTDLINAVGELVIKGPRAHGDLQDHDFLRQAQINYPELDTFRRAVQAAANWGWGGTSDDPE